MISASCGGITFDRWFTEISKHSNSFRFAKDDGKFPLSMLLDRLSKWSPIRSPMTFGIFPSNPLREKSITAKASGIFKYSNSKTLLFKMI